MEQEDQVAPQIKLEVPRLDLPPNLLDFFKGEQKPPTKPADLLIPLTGLSEEHIQEAVHSERSGHGKCNQRFQPFLQTARVSRPKEEAVEPDRKFALSPIEAAREATSRARKPRRRQSLEQRRHLPRNREVLVGWRDLLSEIADSSRRLRSARGGQIEAREPSTRERSASPSSRPRTVSESAASEEEEEGDGLWLSYRITEEIVPNLALQKIWQHAADPRKGETVQPLEKIPRLTVTKREVQPLPAVQDMLQWRQANKRRKEQRKAKKEAERNPTLDEMLLAIFGEPDFEQLQLREVQLAHQRATEALARLRESAGSGPGSGPSPSELQVQAMEEELELLKEVQLLLSMDAEEAVESLQSMDVKMLGALRRGRRGGFDEGKATAKLALSIADLQARQDKNVVRCKKLRKGVEHSRALRELPPAHPRNEKAAQVHMKEVVSSFTAVVAKCETRAQRFHENFVRRQGNLSDRLQRRVKRIQYDHEEIQNMKQQSILPSVTSNASHLSVLQYLKPHRSNVERKRQEAHSIYMRQVEKIQQHQRLLADPNREPERGEIYLSQCFRHVLGAGLAVDKGFFFRVLRHMGPEDFQKTHTVNFLAACCDAFSIPTRDYMDFLQCHGFPLLAPKLCSGKHTGDDTAAWSEVELETCRDERAVPFPVLPTSTQSSELASRDEPLHSILEALYDIRNGNHLLTVASAMAQLEKSQETIATETQEDMERKLQPRPPIQMANPPIIRRGASRVPVVGGRPFVPHGHPTLRSTRGVAEPMSHMAASLAKTTRAASVLEAVQESW
ncbi:unnamed protein product [Effrenium voratum]|nr:unnamed protein product [Effrenium voratum]